jgi:hypothetical protein
MREQLNLQQELKLFTAKLFILAAIFFIPIAATLVVLNVTISSIVSRLVMEADSSRQGNWIAEAAAKLEAMSPDRREMLHRDIRTMVTQLRPFLDDVRPLFSTGSACATKPNGSP